MKNISLVFLLFAVYVLTTDGGCTEAAPANGWEKVFSYNLTSILPLHHYGGKSYYMGTQFKATYHQALAFCEQIHMKLLTIRSEEENDRIFKYIREASKGTEYWTSGTRLIDGYKFLWLPYGETVDYTNWSNGQPSSIHEQCLQVWVIGNKLQWNDRPCNTQFFFICERYDNQPNTLSTL